MAPKRSAGPNLKAKDFRLAHKRVLAAAELAQREQIRDRMGHAGGWGDLAHAESWFTAASLVPMGRSVQDPALRSTWASPATPLRYLNDLALGGFLDCRRGRPGAALVFRFKRGKCDALAAMVAGEVSDDGGQQEREHAKAQGA